MLRAVGLGDGDWDKPQIGIASAWNEVTPCNMTLRKLAQFLTTAFGYPVAVGVLSNDDHVVSADRFAACIQ